MATISTNAIITEVGNRLRDPNNFAHTRATVLDVLSRVQRVLNIGFKLQIASVQFATTAKRALYQNTAIASDIGKIVAVRDGGRDLAEVPWERLADNDPEWIRTEGPQPEVFTCIGRDLLVITPSQPVTAPTLTIYYTTQTPDLVDDVANFPVIPDEWIPLLMDITEAILLMRGRIFTPDSALPELLNRIEAAFTAGAVEQDRRHG